jgi:DNA polymerase-3 subunit beta
MRFNLERDVLAEAVAWVARSLSPRPVLPILSGLLLQAAPGGLTLSCFDYEVSARIRVDAEVAEPGTALVPGRLLAEITRSLPPLEVEFSHDGEDVTLTCGPASFTLVTMPVRDYPRLPELPRLAGTVDGGVLAPAIGQVVPAASRDDTLPIITGVNVEIEGDAIRLVATDRYRLAIRELGWNPADPRARGTLLVPARTLADAARMMALGVPVQILMRDGHQADGTRDSEDSPRAADAMIGFESGGRRLTTRLIAGEYIKYASRFPAEFGSCGDMPAVPLAEAVKRVALVAERGSSVRLSFGDGKVTIEAGTEGQARARETVPADFTGEETTIAFSPNYLLDGLGAALTAATGTGQDKDTEGDGPKGSGEARIRLQFTSPTRPALITGLRASAKPEDESAPDYRYLVVPLRALVSALRLMRARASRGARELVGAAPGMTGHPGHDQYPGGEGEKQQREDQETPRVRRRHRQRRLGAGGPRRFRQVGHQVVDLPLRLRGKRAVDPLGQLIEGEPARHEMLPQLDNRGVAFRVADP